MCGTVFRNRGSDFPEQILPFFGAITARFVPSKSVCESRCLIEQGGATLSGKPKTHTPILFLRGSFPVEVDFSFHKTVLAFVCERMKKARPTVGTGRYENSGRC